MGAYKVNMTEFKSSKVLVIFDLDRVAFTEFMSLHKENFTNKKLQAVKLKGTLYNTSILYGLFEQMVKRPFSKTDYLFSADTREGFSSWMYTRFEQGHLPDTKQEYYSQLNWLRYLLKEMNLNLMEKDGYEAYNFIYKAVYNNYDDYEHIFIFSDDKVLYPLIDSKVSVLSSDYFKPDITLENYEDILGVPYNLLQLKQCTVGDLSLGLKGAFRFGPTSFDKMLLKDKVFEKPLNKTTKELIEESIYLKETQKEQALGDLEWLLPRETPDISTRPTKVHAVDLKSLLHKLNMFDLLEKAEKL